MRPLKYRYRYDDDGRVLRDGAGVRVLSAVPPQEKGVDVRCALAVVREAADPDVDLVVLASSDSDLTPVLDEVRRMGTAKIETCSWRDSTRHHGPRLRNGDRSRPVWNTDMDESAFRASWDPTDYS